MCWNGCAGADSSRQPASTSLENVAEPKVTLENNSLAVALTARADASFMVENPPACGPIPL
jgi:hypothetical protein